MMLSKQCVVGHPTFISMSKSAGNSDISWTQIFLSTANRDPHHLRGGLFFLYMSFVINATVKWTNSEQNTRRAHTILTWKNPHNRKKKKHGRHSANLHYIGSAYTTPWVSNEEVNANRRLTKCIMDGHNDPYHQGRGGGALAPPLPRHYYRAHHMGLTAQASQHKVLLHSSEINPLLYKFGSEQIKLLKIFPTDRKMGCGVVPRDHSGNPILLCS
jgi:hypothetical protein